MEATGTPGLWVCGVCHTTNSSTTPACAACGTHHPSTVDPAAAVTAPVPVVTRDAPPPPPNPAPMGQGGGIATPPAPPGAHGVHGGQGVPVATAGPATGPGGGRSVPLWALIAVVVVGVAAIAGVVILRPGGGSGPTPTTIALPGPDPAVTVTASTAPTTDTPTTTAASTTTTTTAVPTELDPTSITARASSVLPPVPSRGLTYGPDNLLDGDLATAWSQAGTDGGIEPVGSYVTFELPWATDISEISIVNGYVKTDEAYRNNARVRDMRITTDAGHDVYLLLDDRKDVQRHRIDLAGVRYVTLTVSSIYPGAKHEDVALTEVGFTGARGR